MGRRKGFRVEKCTLIFFFLFFTVEGEGGGGKFFFGLHLTCGRRKGKG